MTSTRAPMTGTVAARTSQARLELPVAEMDRVRASARGIGLSLSAFLRQAVLEKAADVSRRMGH